MTDDVFEFEGDQVTDFTAQLPSAKLESPAAYPRGTYLDMTVQVRVRSVRIEEDRQGKLTRHHILALEDVMITNVTTPAQRRAMFEVEQAQADAAAQDPDEYEVAEEPGHEDDVQAKTDEQVQTLENELQVPDAGDGIRLDGQPVQQDFADATPHQAEPELVDVEF